MQTIPWFWYNAGGVLMNLFIMVMSLFLLKWIHPGLIGFSFFVMLIIVGLYMALINGIPAKIGGMSNDGYNIWRLWRHPSERVYFARSLQAIGEQSRGKRLSEMPQEWFTDQPITNGNSHLELTMRNIYMSLLEDKGEYEKAREIAEEIMSLGKNLPQVFQMEIGGELVMLELMTTHRDEVVKELWTKQLEDYIKANKPYSAMKCAVLFVYELLYNHNEEAAITYKEEIEEHSEDYTMPGEVRSANVMIEAAAAIHIKNRMV